MRFFLAMILLLTIFRAAAQDTEFPPNCDKKILSPSVEALCTELRATSLAAEEGYLTALSRVDSLEKWDVLYLVKLRFMASYYECATKGNTRAVIACLTPAFQDALNRLSPATDGTEIQLIRQAQAQQVNAATEARAHELFRKCAFERINAIDDGISPARDIAQGIGAACRPKAAKWAQVRFATLSTSFISSVPTLSDTLALTNQISSPDNLVETVLEYRASKRLKAQPKKKGPASRKIEG